MIFVHTPTVPSVRSTTFSLFNSVQICGATKLHYLVSQILYYCSTMPPPSSSSSSSPPLKILRTYAKLDDASLLTTLPPTVYFSHTRQTLTIFDAYPKALFHFLILPRLNVSVRSAASTTTTLAEDGDGDERREHDSEIKVADTAADLTSLRTLLQRASASSSSSSSSSSNIKDKDEDSDALERAQGTLNVLSYEATRLQSKIEREMNVHYGFKWPIWIGFHAVPSME